MLRQTGWWINNQGSYKSSQAHKPRSPAVYKQEAAPFSWYCIAAQIITVMRKAMKNSQNTTAMAKRRKAVGAKDRLPPSMRSYTRLTSKQFLLYANVACFWVGCKMAAWVAALKGLVNHFHTSTNSLIGLYMQRLQWWLLSSLPEAIFVAAPHQSLSVGPLVGLAQLY